MVEFGTQNAIKEKKDIQLNLKTIARNISLMILPDKKFKIEGETDRLKNGAILYSLHFGVWESMPAILRKSLNKEIGILVNRYTDTNIFIIGKAMDRLLYAWRARYNIRIFYPDEIFKIVKFVKEGGIFSALVDGNKPYSKLKKIERLGRICSVPVVPFVVYYDGRNSIMNINCNLDKLLKQRPFDYWWFYKSRRQ
ncbi:MAG: hypothetical protein ABIL18_01025 [candidate division WOR-3 bacterium]